ncbi:MAG: DUF2142 domain-containing protein [Aristaeellaceae bacterium]
MAKKRTVWTAALLVVWVVAVVLGTEALCQLPVLRLPAEQRGIQPLAAEQLAVEGGEAAGTEEDWLYEEEWAEDESAAAGVYAAAGQKVAVPISGYVQTLTLYGDIEGEDGNYTVKCVLPDGSVWSTKSYFWALQSGVSRDSVTIGREIVSAEVTFTGSGITFTGAETDNRFLWNPYRMLLSGAIAAGLYLLIALRRVIGRRAETGFLVVGLCVGLVLSVCMPPCVGQIFDDETHFGRIATLSHGYPGYRTQAEHLMVELGFTVLYNSNYHHETDTLQDRLAFAKTLDAIGADQTPVTEVSLQWAFSDTGYVTQALGYGLARAVGLPMSWQIIMARVFNMLTYVLLTFLGIRALGRFKLALSAIALMPTPMLLACSLTYDTTINALCFLGTALVMNAILDRETRLTWQRGLAILLTLILGSVSKVVYIPMLLLTLLLPRSKFDSTAARVWYKSLAVALCLMTVATMVMSVGGGAVTLQDSRGGAVDSSAQIAYVLRHPFTYLQTFFYSIWSGFEYYFIKSGRLYLGFGGGISDAMGYVSLLLVIFAAVTDNEPEWNQRLNWKLRLAMLIIAMMAIGMTFTTMYVAYTPVGEGSVAGVQGRYLLPVMPLLCMLCSPEGVQNRMNKTGWHLVFFLLNGIILTAVCMGSLVQLGM